MVKKLIIMTMAAVAISLTPVQAGEIEWCIEEIQSEISECNEMVSQLRSDYATMRKLQSQIRRIARRGGTIEDLATLGEEPDISEYTYYLFMDMCGEREPESLNAFLACWTAVTNELRSVINEKRRYQRSLRVDLRNAIRNGCEEEENCERQD